MRKSDLHTFNFENADFDKLVAGKASYRVAFQQAFLCPCWSKEDSGPEASCPICKGDGYYWQAFNDLKTATATFYQGSQTRPPVLEHAGAQITNVIDEHGNTFEAHLGPENFVVFPEGAEPAFSDEFTVHYTYPQQFRVFIQSIKSQRVWIDKGEVEISDLQATLPAYLEDQTPNPLWFASVQDRFTLLDVQKRYQQRFQRGTRRKEILTYKSAVPTVARSIVNGALVEYLPFEDFIIQNAEVQWVGERPPVDHHYTLEYTCNPEYYVFNELAQARHMGGENQVRTLLLRLFELYPGRGRQ